MIKRHPYLIGASVGCLIAVVANAQTLGPTPSGIIGTATGTSLALTGALTALSGAFNGCVLSGADVCTTFDLHVGGLVTVNGAGGPFLQGNGAALAGIGGGGSPSSFEFRLGGAFDAAAPVAITLGNQNVATGTNNTAGANLNIAASRSTGTLSGGNIIFDTTPPGLSSSTQNPLVQALVIDAATHLRVGSMTTPSISSCGGGSPSVVGTDTSGTITFGTTATTCTLTWTTAYNAAPNCIVTWQNNLASMNYTPSNTNLLISQTSTSSNKAIYICFGRNGG